AAVLNTNVAAATALVAWLAMDMMAYNKASLLGAVNGMVAGLVAITPAAGYVNGTGALLIGLAAGVIPWLTMNKLGKVGIFKKVDDTLGVIHTHYFAGAVGGLMTGLLADPHIMEYIGKTGFSVTGLFYGNPKQFFLQLLGLIVITVYDGVMTFIILKLISLVVPLRSSEADLSHGDIRIHGEMVYEEPIPIGLMGGEEVKEQDI
ncbi:MAG TPA: ammonium transporter, partial [Sulfobacillus sp.]|nr:ammonium transporter [Sulfobacillus sp.]